MALLFCCDPSYFQHLAVALASLLENNRRHALDVTIVVSARDAEAERKLLGTLPTHPSAAIRVMLQPIERVRDLPTSYHISSEAYLRLLAIDLLPPDCTKVIYLDCDVVVVGDLGPLWETDIAAHALAAVPDPYGADRPAGLGMPPTAAYVNSGVLLLNVRRWREQELAARVIDFAARTGSALVYHDQDAINAVLHAETLALPYRWNCQAAMFRGPRPVPEGARDAVAAAVRDPAIIHYTSAQKPWMFTAFMPRRAVYHHYLKKTAWRGTPLTRRSLAHLPEALFNGAAYTLRLRYTYDRFLRSTTAGRVLVRGRLALSTSAAALCAGAARAMTRASAPKDHQP
jgi:lipopolysaccharide biosynthesis glycosyltransferase